MDHHPVTHINPYMGHRPRAVIGSREKDNVPRFGFGGRNNRALIVNALRCGTGQVVNAAVGKDPADKAAAIKAGGWVRAAPNIGVAQVLLRFGNQRGKGRVGQGFTGDLIMLPFRGVRVDVVPEQIGLVAL